MVAGVLVVQLTRASLVERVDRELLSIADGATRIQRLAALTSSDTEAGRRLAVMRLDKRGNVTRAFPSGFADDPDPLPGPPRLPGRDPGGAPSGRSSSGPRSTARCEYRVLTERGEKAERDRGGRGAAWRASRRPSGPWSGPCSSVGALAMAGLLLVAWFVIRRGLLPLERIAATAEQITAGDLSHRAGVPHDDTEVGRLGTAFDSMLDQIETSFDEQQRALDAKERSEDRLRRFVADASHELRTPLTTVRGYADLYRAGGLADPEELATAMDRIGTESRRMAALVEDLLLLARLDQGRPIRRDPVDLSRIADDAVADLRAIEPDRPVVGAIDPGVGGPGRRRPPPPGASATWSRTCACTPGRGRRSRSSCGRTKATPSCAWSTTARASTPSSRPARLRPLLPRRRGPLAGQRRHRPGPRHRRRPRRARTAASCGTRPRPGEAPRSWCGFGITAGSQPAPGGRTVAEPSL